MRELLIAHHFGTGLQADSYFAAFYIPGYFFMLLGNNTLANAVVPLLIEKDERPYSERLSTVLSTFLIAGLSLVIVLFLAAPVLCRWLFPGLRGPAMYLTVRLSEWMAPAVLFIVFSISLTAFFQSREKFLWPAVSGLVMVSAMVLSVVLAPHLIGIYTVGLGLVVGAALQVAVLWGGLVRCGYRIRVPRSWAASFDMKIVKRSLPVLAASLFFFAVDVMLRSLASGLAEGGISALVYASKIVVLPGIVVAIPVSTVFLPRLTKLFQNRDDEAFRQVCLRALGFLTIVLIPFALLSFLLRDSIVRVLFHHGVFTDHSVALTSAALAAFSPAILFGPLTILLQTVYYSRQDSQTPLFSGIPLVGTMLILGHLFAPHYGIRGVAAAYSLAWLSAAMYLFVNFVRTANASERRKIGRFAASVSIAGGTSLTLTAYVLAVSASGFWYQVRILGSYTGVFCFAYLTMLLMTGAIGPDHLRQVIGLFPPLSSSK